MPRVPVLRSKTQRREMDPRIEAAPAPTAQLKAQSRLAGTVTKALTTAGNLAVAVMEKRYKEKVATSDLDASTELGRIGKKAFEGASAVDSQGRLNGENYMETVKADMEQAKTAIMEKYSDLRELDRRKLEASVSNMADSHIAKAEVNYDKARARQVRGIHSEFVDTATSAALSGDYAETVKNISRANKFYADSGDIYGPNVKEANAREVSGLVTSLANGLIAQGKHLEAMKLIGEDSDELSDDDRVKMSDMSVKSMGGLIGAREKFMLKNKAIQAKGVAERRKAQEANDSLRDLTNMTNVGVGYDEVSSQYQKVIAKASSLPADMQGEVLAKAKYSHDMSYIGSVLDSQNPAQWEKTIAEASSGFGESSEGLVAGARFSRDASILAEKKRQQMNKDFSSYLLQTDPMAVEKAKMATTPEGFSDFYSHVKSSAEDKGVDMGKVTILPPNIKAQFAGINSNDPGAVINSIDGLRALTGEHFGKALSEMTKDPSIIAFSSMVDENGPTLGAADALAAYRNPDLNKTFKDTMKGVEKPMALFDEAVNNSPVFNALRKMDDNQVNYNGYRAVAESYYKQQLVQGSSDHSTAAEKAMNLFNGLDTVEMGSSSIILPKDNPAKLGVEDVKMRLDTILDNPSYAAVHMKIKDPTVFAKMGLTDDNFRNNVYASNSANGITLHHKSTGAQIGGEMSWKDFSEVPAHGPISNKNLAETVHDMYAKYFQSSGNSSDEKIHAIINRTVVEHAVRRSFGGE